MLIPLSLAETKSLNWRGFQAWFHQIPALHCPPAITVTSTQISLECFSQHPVETAFFGHYFSHFTEERAQNCPDFLQLGHRMGQRSGNCRNSHESLRNTYKTQESKEQEWEGREDEEPAPAQRGHHHHCQQHFKHCPKGPEHLEEGKPREKWGMQCSQGLFGTFQAVLTWREKFQGNKFCLKIFQGQNPDFVTLTRLDEDVELNSALNLWSCQLSKSITEMHFTTKS